MGSGLWFASQGHEPDAALAAWISQSPAALPAWSEGLCPKCLARLQFGVSRYCPACRGWWHLHREPLPQAERDRVKPRYPDILPAQEAAGV